MCVHMSVCVSVSVHLHTIHTLYVCKCICSTFNIYCLLFVSIKVCKCTKPVQNCLNSKIQIINM